MNGQVVILTGASGSGKTIVAQEILEKEPAIWVMHFDDIGVPPVAEMIADYDSPESWQHAKTVEWLETLAARRQDADVLLEGQMRIAFIKDAAERAGIADYRLMLIDCDEATRAERIAPRVDADRAYDGLSPWAAFLRAEARDAGLPVIDTSGKEASASADAVLRLIGGPYAKRAALRRPF